MKTKNIYDIFEERKFDIFYIEHFSFNELEEIDIVFENIEKYILDDNEVIMEGFKEKIKDMKGVVKKKITNIVRAIKKILNDLLRKFNEKYEPVKKYINKIGKEEIIKKLEGRKIRMINIYSDDFNFVIRSLNSFVNRISIESTESADHNLSDSAIGWAVTDGGFEGKLDKKRITTCIDLVYNYKNIMGELDNVLDKAEKKYNSILVNVSNDEDKSNLDKSLKIFTNCIQKCMNILNRNLIICAKLIMKIPVKEKNVNISASYDDFQ